jgi:citrate synthase
MIGFYVLRGHDHDKLANLSNTEKLAYILWMEQYYKEKQEEYKAFFGGK